MRVGVVVALAAEARALAGRDIAFEKIVEINSHIHVFVCGMTAGAATRAAQALADSGVEGLVSFGMAGALDAQLRAGDLLLPETVIDEQGRHFATDAAWREALRAPLTLTLSPLRGEKEQSDAPIIAGTLLTTARPLLSSAEKSAARARTGANAVDMESAAVAAVAQTRALPFIAVRAVIDRASDTVPSVATSADNFGRARPLRLASALLRHPAQLLALVRLGAAYARALATLRNAAAVLT